MITTLSTQAGRRYPQMGSTGLPWAGRLPSIGEINAPTTQLYMRSIRGNDATGLDDWTISYQG